MKHIERIFCHVQPEDHIEVNVVANSVELTIRELNTTSGDLDTTVSLGVDEVDALIGALNRAARRTRT